MKKRKYKSLIHYFWILLKLRIHVALLFSLLIFNSINNIINYSIIDKILISLSSFFLLTFIYIFNKITDRREDILNFRRDALSNKHQRQLIITVIILFIIPIFYLIRNLKLFMLYIFGAILGFLYSQKITIFNKKISVKNIFLIKNVLSALGWSIAYTFVPVILKGSANSSITAIFFVMFFLVMAIEILWDIKDIKGDKRLGIKTIPNYLGIGWAKIVSSLLVIAAIIVMVLLSANLFSSNLYFIIAAVLLLGFVFFAKERRSLLYYHSIIFLWIFAYLLYLFV